MRMKQLGIPARAAMTALLFTPAFSHGGSFDDIRIDNIPICHGFGCRFQESVSISDKEWTEIETFFRTPAETPEAERDQIKKATGWFEVIMGRHTPIHLDKGRNEIPGHAQTSMRYAEALAYSGNTTGQMDCIDESLNITTYMRLMEQAGLFKHYRVVERAHRRSAFDQHYAGQVEEIATGERWVVDSWFYDYGSLPYIEESTEWHDLPLLFSTAFPE